MAVAETFLIYTLTFLSAILTFKGIKTSIMGSYYFVGELYEKIKGLQVQKDPSFFEKVKSTLMPFIDSEYYKKMRRKRIVNTIYIVNFLLGLFLIITLFWSILIADIDTVIDKSPYLIDPIVTALRTYQMITKIGSALFILGFLIEVINTIRSLFI